MYFSYGNDYQVSRYLCIIVPFCITHNLCLIFPFPYIYRTKLYFCYDHIKKLAK